MQVRTLQLQQPLKAHRSSHDMLHASVEQIGLKTRIVRQPLCFVSLFDHM